MECNRDEALRAREIAERKFLLKDFKGAKKLALRAKNLYPELDGISQMLLTLDVYISSEGESNWYNVLGVTPFSDDKTIRKQYRKLAFLLHPDKNRSLGAEGAFKLVTQAWSLLSDKSRRMAYDKTRSQNATFQPAKYPFHDFARNGSAEASVLNKGNKGRETGTFWTVCHRCKMQYEYMIVYLNHNLLCPNCGEIYFAFKIDPPANRDMKGRFRQQKSKQMGSSGSDAPKRERRKQESSSMKKSPPSSHTKVAEESNHRNPMRQRLLEKARAEIIENLNTGITNEANKKLKKSDQPDQLFSESKLANQPSSSSWMPVPVSDFHDFDANRRAESFKINQVWALYDDEGMPRNYAMIRGVRSLNPFTVELTWLRSVTHFGIRPLTCYTDGSSETCGEFRMGKPKIFDRVECFSHEVSKSRSSDNAVVIFPRRGEIWALYRNWSLDWNELTEFEALRKFDVVQVLEDHDKCLGVVVVPLVKVAGSKSVFRQHFDPDEIRRIPTGEIGRFSHRVPCRRLTGEENVNRLKWLLKDCVELDPAAVPPEILEAAALNIDESREVDNNNTSLHCHCVINLD